MFNQRPPELIKLEHRIRNSPESGYEYKHQKNGKFKDYGCHPGGANPGGNAASYYGQKE